MRAFLIGLTLASMLGWTACSLAGPQQPGPHEEPAFGIEFSMENIIISFIPPVGRATGLAIVKGARQYQDLMLRYWELCFQAQDSQVPPWTYDEYHKTMTTEYRSQMILRPELDWYGWYKVKVLGHDEAPETLLELDAYRNDTDVAILAKAVKDVKRAAVDILADQYNITMSDWPFLAVAAPSFMWTTIEPEPCDEDLYPYCGPPYDSRPEQWHHVFALKMAGAVHRAGFRREVFNTIDAIMQAHAGLDYRSPIAPAGYAAFWDPHFPLGAKTSVQLGAVNYGTPYEGEPAVVIELTNATLTLWAQQKYSIWSPWTSRRHDGAARLFGRTDDMDDPKDPIWSSLVLDIQRLREFMSYPDSEVLDIYLIGDAWEQYMATAFRSYLDARKCTDMKVELRDMFAASNGAASVAREMLNAHGPPWLHDLLDRQRNETETRRSASVG